MPEFPHYRQILRHLIDIRLRLFRNLNLFFPHLPIHNLCQRTHNYIILDSVLKQTLIRFLRFHISILSCYTECLWKDTFNKNLRIRKLHHFFQFLIRITLSPSVKLPLNFSLIFAITSSKVFSSIPFTPLCFAGTYTVFASSKAISP